MARGIRDRTESGRAVAGRPFRRKADGSPPNLIDTGQMVESLKPTKIRADGFTLAPTGKRNRAIAHIHQNTGREWIGADERQIRDARAGDGMHDPKEPSMTEAQKLQIRASEQRARLN